VAKGHVQLARRRGWLDDHPGRSFGFNAPSLRDMQFSRVQRTPTKLIVALSSLVVVESVRLVRLYRSVKGNRRYWEQRASASSQENDFIYLALGDSVANAIGASRPQNGYVGLLAQEIEALTSRPVRVINISVTGATAADLVRDQLPRIRHLRPDLVTLDIGANDVNKKLPEDGFMRDFTTILDALPAGKTIVADLPTFKHGPQRSTLIRLNAAIHAQVAAHEFQLAPIFEVTSATIGDLRTYGADFFHPSNRGHRNWSHAFESQLGAIFGD